MAKCSPNFTIKFQIRTTGRTIPMKVIKTAHHSTTKCKKSLQTKCTQLYIKKWWKPKIPKRIQTEWPKTAVKILLTYLKPAGIKCKTNMIRGINRGLKNQTITFNNEWNKLKRKTHSKSNNKHTRSKMKNSTKNSKNAHSARVSTSKTPWAAP